MITTLGISAFYHDSAAALLQDGVIVAAAQEERFTRRKHDSAFPANAVKFVLKDAGININDLDAVAFYDKPFLKFERLLETYYAFAPKGLRSFLTAMPVWIKEKLFLKKLILEEFAKADEEFNNKNIKLLFPEHHLSHAASSFFPSPFSEAAILTVDGVGEWATSSICHGENNTIKILCELRFPHSVGLLYSAFTYYLGFRVNSGEYKLMGLAPYGNPLSGRVRKFETIIREQLVDIKDDGSIWLDQEFFDYSTGLTMVKEDRWQRLFGLPRRNSESDMTQEYCDLALAIQNVTEKILFNMAREAKSLTGSRFLCLGGGVALNCVANGKLLKNRLFDDIWIQPAAGDAGGALGAAYCAHHIFLNIKRVAVGMSDQMQGSYLGPDFSPADIRLGVRKFKAVYEDFEDFDLLCERVADVLQQGKVVGWFQGRMEWGPRALGNRSIIADARNPEMQKKLNLKIKFREGFRPFAPSVLAEDAAEYFDIDKPSPYMLLVAEVNKHRSNPLPDAFNEMDWKDKLYFVRSDIPAVTHIDFSARLQTVHKETNPRYWQLISKFKELTGYGIVVNTSFNIRGEPIVCSPQDAYRCFMRTDMDYLVIGNVLFDKEVQPAWNDTSNWREKYALD